MVDVSFYILTTHTEHDRLLFVCKLIEKAYRQQQNCYVVSDSTQQSQQLDNQLWTFRAGSFVPHQIYDSTLPEFNQTILIGTQSPPPQWQRFIINLGHSIPPYSNQTERVAEIIDGNPEIKQAGRERYRQYHQNGIEITTHNL